MMLDNFIGEQQLRGLKKIIGKNSFPVMIPRNRALDIDTIEDWFIAERMFEVSKNLLNEFFLE